MCGVSFVRDFYPKVIDNKNKGCGLPGVPPKSWCELAFEVAMFSKSSFKLFVG